MDNNITIIKDYVPVNEQETVDKEATLQFLEAFDNGYLRENLIGHITSSAIILNETYDKVLFIHHNIYNAWGWVGGHADGDKDLLHVAVKEAKEETGIQDVHPFDDQLLGIDVIYVAAHYKNGIYVGDHLHFNVTYLLIANEAQDLSVKHDENSGVRWFEIDQVCDHVEEERMIPIYKKLFKEAKKRVRK